MTTVRTVPTADLDPRARVALRELLDLAFDGEFADEDWDHALGGLHMIVAEGGRPVAHAAVVQRRLLLGDSSLRCGYLEAVAVHPDRRRRGLAAAVLARAEHVIDSSFHLGALSSSDEGRALYLGRGWQPWTGGTAVLAPSGVTRTPEDDDSTLVRGLSGSGVLVCDWRDGDVW
ncbi:GNAT family N-acetyltransferase [Actinoplanes sp. DH11]|uniref:GNAT family N-acetyltransferase n=1 Tax=Actinoplanes sp. DH11 TaxID=2857011 RepID=UPI001E4B0651|nr:GNAT family N-acetyltransferase [Actinoplanes sp. DH11]